MAHFKIEECYRILQLKASGGHGHSALCTELDVASQGETAVEARKNLEEAVTLYLETVIENNLPFIRPVREEENPLVTRKNDVTEVFRLDVELDRQVHA